MYCHLISEFLNFNYNGISSGEELASPSIKHPPSNKRNPPLLLAEIISALALIRGDSVVVNQNGSPATMSHDQSTVKKFTVRIH